MSERVVTEMALQVWYENGEGYHIKVSRDDDALDMVQVKPGDRASEEYWGKFCITFPPELARHVANAMIRIADDIETKE